MCECVLGCKPVLGRIGRAAVRCMYRIQGSPCRRGQTNGCVQGSRTTKVLRSPLDLRTLLVDDFLRLQRQFRRAVRTRPQQPL